MNDDDIVQELILNGSLEVAGMDLDNGEMLYRFTEKMAVDHPNIYHDYQAFFSKAVYSLWELGFVEMEITDDNPMVRLTEKAFDEIAVKKLDKEKQYNLKEIIRLLTEQ
jgi:hypothetical protein